MSRRVKHLYEFGPFALDPAEHTLLRDGRPVSIRPKVFDLLLVLVERHNHLVEKDELMDALWPGQEVEEGNLNKTVSLLRLALGENGNGVRYIETVPKRGYRFAADVREVGGDGDPESVVGAHTRATLVYEEETDGETQAADGGPRVGSAVLAEPTKELWAKADGVTGPRFRGKRSPALPLVASAAVAIIALTAVAYLFYRAGGGEEAIDSVAVLPFVNASGDPDAEYLTDGISDGVINSLSRLPDLRVISLSGVLRYKGKQIDPQAVGRELNVRAVLVGRMTPRGDNLSISTELVDVRDNRRLWSEQYSRKLSDILVVQDEIAREVAEGLRPRLSNEEKQQLTKHHTKNPGAYRLYILGVYGSRLRAGREALEQRVEYLEQAVKLDPDYALAYVGLQNAYYQLGFRGFWPPKEASQKGERAALKAVELDDTLPQAHLALGREKMERDWAGAEKHLKRALELDPNSVEANDLYALYLVHSARWDEGIAYARRAEQLELGQYGYLSRPAHLPFLYFLARRYDAAIKGYKDALEKSPNNGHLHFFLGEAYVVKGMHREGIAELQKAVALNNEPERWDRYPVLAWAYALAGQRAEALKILGEQQRLAKQRYISPYNFAIIHTGLGDRDRAFEYLNRAYEEGVYVMNQLPVRPLFDSLRSDPRYADLLRRMGRVQ